MSANPLLLTVSLKQLSSDCKTAGAALPAAELYYVSLDQLGKLLKSLQAVAPTLEPSLEPEVRITGSTGKFVVRVKLGELHLVSWAAAHKGGVVTPADVIAAVGGEADEESAVVQPGKARAVRGVTASAGKSRGSDSKLTYVGLGLAIVAVNAFTVWFITRPPRTLAESYKLLGPDDAQRVLAIVSGNYETGRGQGDRRLEIAKDGAVQRIKFGAGGAPRDRQAYTTQPAEAEGKSALVTNKKTLIRVKDPFSVVLYGDTYTKVTN